MRRTALSIFLLLLLSLRLPAAGVLGECRHPSMLVVFEGFTAIYWPDLSEVEGQKTHCLRCGEILSCQLSAVCSTYPCQAAEDLDSWDSFCYTKTKDLDLGERFMIQSPVLSFP